MKIKHNAARLIVLFVAVFGMICLPLLYTGGYEKGYDQGRADAMDKWYDIGYSAGYDAGFAEGASFYSNVRSESGIASDNYSSESSDSAVQSIKWVYVTNTGTKYHRADCSYLRDSSRRISYHDAINSGYEPCSRCY